MATGNVGDRVVVESERVGQAAREGEIVEVLGSASEVHYRVRWQDGHESIFFPSGRQRDDHSRTDQSWVAVATRFCVARRPLLSCQPNQLG